MCSRTQIYTGICCLGLVRARLSGACTSGARGPRQPVRVLWLGAGGAWALPVGADSLKGVDLELPGAVGASGYLRGTQPQRDRTQGHRDEQRREVRGERGRPDCPSPAASVPEVRTTAGLQSLGP